MVRRLIASALVAVLMTMTLSMPALAAKPGSILTITVTSLGGTLPTCSYRIESTIAKVHKDGYIATVRIWQGIHPETSEPVVDLAKYATSIPATDLTGTHFTASTPLYVVVGIFKPVRGGTAWLDQGTAAWSLGTDCSATGVVAQYP